MGRSINSTTKSELLKDSYRLATLMEFDFSTPIKITDYGQTIVDATYGTFVSSGHILEITDISETASLKGNKITVNLSGVDQSYIQIMLSGTNINKKFRMLKATLDENGSVIGAPFVVYEGLIVGYAISDSDDSSEIGIEVASHWTDFERVAGRKTNSNSQNTYFPNDRGMDFSSKTKKEVKWGRK